MNYIFLIILVKAKLIVAKKILDTKDYYLFL